MHLRDWCPVLPRARGAGAIWLTGISLLAGCTSYPQPEAPSFRPVPLTAPIASRPVTTPAVRQVAYTEAAPLDHSPAPGLPFVGAAELTEAKLIEAVLLRNPTVAQMTAAWQAAAARYPQVSSLNDPQFGGTIGPASIGSPDVDFAYRLEVSQAIPYPGKRELRGQGALREAAAAGFDLDDTRLQLAETARAAFANYFLVARATEVGEENLKLLDGFRKEALSQFKVGKASLQDSLQAEVAIARQRERLLTLDRQRKVAQARLNTLMHLPPDSPLPPPPKQLDTAAPFPPVAELRNRALARPDVVALRERVAADESALALAVREYKPDFEVMAAYDSYWQPRERDLRPMIGVKMNIPVRLARRDAAVAEARARLAQRRAELDRLTDRVQFEVQEAYEQLAESEKAITLFEKTTLPKAKENVDLAMSEYAVNKVPFLNLIEAQRNQVELRDRYYEVLAELLRRRAALERAVGGPASTSPGPSPSPRPMPVPVPLP